MRRIYVTKDKKETSPACIDETVKENPRVDTDLPCYLFTQMQAGRELSEIPWDTDQTIFQLFQFQFPFQL